LLPSAWPLTAAERSAIPPVARALAVVILVGAVFVALGAARRRLRLVAAGYAVPVLALPILSAGLMRAVGDDRSAGTLADSVRGKGEIIAVAAYPPSLPFYLGRRVLVATANAHELTSNFIADYADELRGSPDSPLLPADAWRDRLTRCPEPTVFVARSGNAAVRDTLARLPLLFADGHYAAYGPCPVAAR
jgi:hypothetical protein